MDYSKHNNEKKRKKIRSNAAKSRKKVSFNIFRFTVLAILLIIVVGAAAAIGGFKGVIDSAPDISASDVMPSKLKSVMYYPDGQEAVELVGAQSNRTIASIKDIPDCVPNAFIAIEDNRFYEHNGIDPKGIVRALFVGLSHGGNFSEGASTITQQLIKLTVFDGGAETDTIQRFKRKFQEWYLALKLEKEMSKAEIMEAYLNTINLGRGAYGIEAAAERYFNKKCSDLTISEAAVIAAIAQSPSYNNPIDGQQVNAQRRDKILNNMLTLGFINQQQYDEAKADDVYSRIAEVNEITKDKEVIYTWFEDAAIDQVLKDLQEKLGYTSAEANTALYSGGLQIYLTQNRHIQDIVDRYYNDDDNFPSTEYRLHWALTYKDEDGQEVNIDENSLQSYYGKDDCDLLYDNKDQAKQSIADFLEAKGITDDDIIAQNFDMTVQVQSSFVLMDQSTGYVLALSGGRGEKKTSRSFNRATQSTRQPGSVFKTIAVFLPALDSCGLSLASTKEDEPYTTPDGYQPFNTNANSYQGTTTIREAITHSMNVVTTKWLVEDVTPKLGIKYLENLGITTMDEENDAYAPLGLGGISNGVTNLELTGAYAAIANGGVYTQPILYSKILDKDGNVLLDNVPEKHTAMKDSTAWLLTSAMEDVVSKGTGTPAQISNYGIAEAGKTGTTDDYKDLWFVGYTPYYTAGIWFGYDDSTLMRYRLGYNYNAHKVLWKNIMNEVLEGYEDRDFVMPSDVEKLRVCSTTGLLASYGCPTTTEYFAKDTAPTEYCSRHSYRYYQNDDDDDSSSSSDNSSSNNSGDNSGGDNSGNNSGSNSGDNSGGDNSGDNSGGDNSGDNSGGDNSG
ncbi:MAG: PBP1A family penicillin-binding protein, partial [Coprococcus sp.]|nr:PBP1A family penicillin-binding protein [Coprococcus sp.]